MIKKLRLFLLIALPVYLYFMIFLLPYAVWEFPLTQNWFTDNGLVEFRDVIYHHTPLPLFFLYATSKILGNTFEMLRFSSYILALLFGYTLFLTGKRISQQVGLIILILFYISFPAMFNNFNIEEMFASLFTLMALYFFLRFWQNHSLKSAFLVGIFVALGFMGKQVTGGILIAFLMTIIVYKNSNKDLDRILLKAFVVFLLGISIPIASISSYYLFNDALSDFFYWNITFNLFVYPKLAASYAQTEGLITSSWLFLSLIPAFLLLFKTKEINLKPKLLAVTLSTIFLSVSLLPSYLNYKILPFYPYPLLLWSIILEKYKSNINKFFIITGLVIMLFVIKPFYIDYLPVNAFQNSFVSDYTNEDLQVVDWLKTNTPEKAKIMNLGNHYITTLAHKLPQNRYVYIFPWLVYPYEQTSKEILENPPKVVILDYETWPQLYKEWSFISYVEKNYKSAAKYGKNEIFTLK